MADMTPNEAPRPIGNTDNQPLLTIKDITATSKKAIKNPKAPAALMWPAMTFCC